MKGKQRQITTRTVHPLRRGGVANRTWELIGEQAQVDIAQRAGVSLAALAVLGKANCSTSVRRRLFETLVQPVRDSMVDALGAASDQPTVEELALAANEVVGSHSLDEVRLLFACVVEWCLPARKSILELVSNDERYAIAPLDSVVSIPRMDVRCAEPDVRAQRRARRERFVAEQGHRRRQREAAKDSPKTDNSARAETGVEVEVVEVDSVLDLDLLVPTRLVDRRLPKGVDGVSEPVGSIGSAYIRWGPGGRYGKRRPVVIVGVSDDHVWVRPCYSRDVCAGRWRAAAIKDWAECGLEHTSFVDLQVHRLPRSQVKVGPGRLTIYDWNRICRGEVQPT